MADREAIKVDMYVMLGLGCLAWVEKVDDTGFTFRCDNGAWNGRFDHDRQSVYINERCEWVASSIVSTTQPPEDVRRAGYNRIIPWMLEHAGDAR